MLGVYCRTIYVLLHVRNPIDEPILLFQYLLNRNKHTLFIFESLIIKPRDLIFTYCQLIIPHSASTTLTKEIPITAINQTEAECHGPCVTRGKPTHDVRDNR